MSEARSVRLDHANATLAGHVPKPAPGARERVWRGVEKQRRPWLRFGWPEAAVFAAALTVVFFVRRGEAPDASWRTVATGASVAVHGATVRAMTTSTVRTPPVEGQRTVVQLVDGHLAFEVAPRTEGATFEVQTRHAIVTVVGTHFGVRADDGGTVVEVDEGVVDVAPRSAAARRLRAGERIRIASAAAIAATDRAEEPNAGPTAGPNAPGEVEPVIGARGAGSNRRPSTLASPVKSPGSALEPEAERTAERGDASASSPGARAEPESNAVAVQRGAGSAPRRTAAPERAPEDAPTAATPPPAAPRAAETAPLAARPAASPEERLRIARRVVASDASRAAALASSVLDEAPAPALEAEALAVLADARRRAGDDASAAELYRALADHPAGAAYGEEALLQLALVSRDAGRLEAASAALDLAADRYPDGPLGQERAALGARLALADGAPGHAAELLLAAPDHGLSLELIRARLDVAQVLVDADPDAARRLLRVDTSRWPAGLARRAEALEGRLDR